MHILTRRRALGLLVSPFVAIPLRNIHAAPAKRVVFSQPTYTDGIGPHFSVTGGTPPFNPVGQFYLHANQANPWRADHDFQPVAWDAGYRTGLHIPGDRRPWQRGIWAGTTGNGHTVAQVYGDTVGAYFRSDDYYAGTPSNRLMISPNYSFPAPLMVPFGKAGTMMQISVDLRVPTASGLNINMVSNAYVRVDARFVSSSTGTQFAFSTGLFAFNGADRGDHEGFDDLAQSAIALVSLTGNLVTTLPGCDTFQSVPYSNWRSYAFTFSRDQFAHALALVAPIAATYGKVLPLDPDDYKLETTHLNAEGHGTPSAPSSLGWSMRGLTLAAW